MFSWNARTTSGFPSLSICEFRIGPAALPYLFQFAGKCSIVKPRRRDSSHAIVSAPGAAPSMITLPLGSTFNTPPIASRSVQCREPQNRTRRGTSLIFIILRHNSKLVLHFLDHARNQIARKVEEVPLIRHGRDELVYRGRSRVVVGDSLHRRAADTPLERLQDGLRHDPRHVVLVLLEPLAHGSLEVHALFTQARDNQFPNRAIGQSLDFVSALPMLAHKRRVATVARLKLNKGHRALLRRNLVRVHADALNLRLDTKTRGTASQVLRDFHAARVKVAEDEYRLHRARLQPLDHLLKDVNPEG